jgi:hypothetical protein
LPASKEASDELFTFTTFPISQSKALRTNALERINEEFRGRTKTQASLPSEEEVLFRFSGLPRSGRSEKPLIFNAGGGTRTRTELALQRILRAAPMQTTIVIYTVLSLSRKLN